MGQPDASLEQFNHPDHYNNREVSWLRFNQRVLEEAVNQSNPILERLRFVAIFSSNLDEFFMIRVAGLKDQVRANFHERDDKSALTPDEQLMAIGSEAHTLVDIQQIYYHRLLNELKNNNIQITSFEHLPINDIDWLKDYFEKSIFSSLTPLAIDPYRSFPLLANKSLNIAVTLSPKSNPHSTRMAIIRVPELIERVIKIKDSHYYVFLEDIIIYFSAELFPSYDIKSTTIFRITRNADMTIHEEDAQDLLVAIESELDKREWGAPVRLEVSATSYDQQVVRFLKSVFDIKEHDIYLQSGPLDLTFLNDFYERLKTDFKQLTYPIREPQPTPDLDLDNNLFDQIRKKDIMLHHPYESFAPVIQLIREAAYDPKVLAIKQTLYRVSENSPIIKSLEYAAKVGKQVTVLVELKARFDEQNNVHWAKRLERAGCHVIYGISGLKTHSKICLIVRKGEGKIEHFVHLGTGNYNEQTATLYTDISIISARETLGTDAAHFFNFLTGAIKTPTYQHLSMAPYHMRDDFLMLINQEVKYQQKFGTGRIIAKMNALTDKVVITKLYEASQKGVKIDLIVRGICSLKPGIPNISENIRVHSIVGRYLEHSRIYYFYNNADEKYYLSSADWMTRNLQRRVELLFPVLDEQHKDRIKDILDTHLNDNTNRREQNELGLYYSALPAKNKSLINSQLTFYDLAYKKTNITESNEP